MKDPEALVEKLVQLGFTDAEMKRKLMQEGVSENDANTMVKVYSTNRFFRKSNILKMMSGVALAITIVAIVLLPSTNGRAAALGAFGSIVGGAVVFTTSRRGGDKSWTGMAAIALGAFVLLSFMTIDFNQQTIRSAATEAPLCEEVGGYCAESCENILEPTGLCPDGLFCCAGG